MSAGSGAPGAAPLRMTIGTFIAFDETGAYSMAEEIRLAKVALLYADEALLFSPGVSMVSQLHLGSGRARGSPLPHSCSWFWFGYYRYPRTEHYASASREVH
ncbi:MAG: hypothetical protein M3522_01100 [Actinomycetota bacterium]|nr:hypothetical protein [Actinomycetota bacterium]